MSFPRWSPGLPKITKRRHQKPLEASYQEECWEHPILWRGESVALVQTSADAFQPRAGGSPAGDVVRDLSRRELLILRTLTEGASNKVIALKLVITESTVKVHMKAILRKLRLQNRTQAAIWARTHLGELLENARA
jgi:ATP/maltotriose-dependent transcriptional regulator MalT